jgi:hypothetical protein
MRNTERIEICQKNPTASPKDKIARMLSSAGLYARVLEVDSRTTWQTARTLRVLAADVLPWWIAG